MAFPFFIARRYLFSKKSHNAINIISGISAAGVAFAAAALLCVLGVFNGFRDLIGSLYTNFDPQLEVRPVEGKFADAQEPILTEICKQKEVQAASYGLDELAMVPFQGRPVMVHVKGVDDNFRHCSNIDSILYCGANPNAEFILQAAGVEYAVPSIGLTQQFGGIDFQPLPICAPQSGERINLSNPQESFNVEEIHASGLFFYVHQKTYDDNYLITSLDFAQRLFDKAGQVSSVALQLRPDANVDAVKERMRTLAKGKYTVNDRYEQHREIFNVMQIEKTMAYLFLTFIVLVASFNIIGSVAMLIIDKRNDIETLRHLGASPRDIVRIFLHESRLITLLGAAIGIVVGLLLCWVQIEFGLIRFGGAEGSFIIDAYPVSVQWTDVVLVFVTVIIVGFLTAWLPVSYLTRKVIGQRDSE